MPSTPNRPLTILTFGGLGDALLTTPAFRALKAQSPERPIRVICANARHARVLRHNPNIDLLTSAKLLYRLFVPKNEIIFPAYNALVPSLTFSKPATDVIADILHVRLTDRRLEVFLTDAERAKARERVQTDSRPFVVLCPSSALPVKAWPDDRWAELIRRRADLRFAQLGVRSDRLVPGAVDLRSLSIRDAMAVIAEARSFVGTESFFAHVTNAFGVRGVVLFGPSAPHTWGHPNNVNLTRSLSCSPCLDRLLGQCAYARECMSDISVDEVEAALMSQLEVPV